MHDPGHRRPNDRDIAEAEIEQWKANKDFWRHGRVVVWWSVVGMWLGGTGEWIASAAFHYLQNHIHWSP